MSRVFLLLLFINASTGLNAQSIPDSEFSWDDSRACSLTGATTEIFLKVEEDPVLLEYSMSEFADFVQNLIFNLKLEKDLSGFLKLKLLFAVGQGLCLNKIGTKDIFLNHEQIERLYSELNSISEIDYGKQRNKIVNFQGILYISVSNGRMKSIRPVNFRLN